jgi:multidrug efflux system membrane fusion protein
MRTLSAAPLALVAGLALTHLAALAQPPAAPSATGGLPASAPKPALLIADFDGHKAVTRSSRDSTLAFPYPAEIIEITAHGGQPVKRGDLIIRARDEEYRYQRDLQQLMADSTLDIDKAQATLDQAQVEYDAQLAAKAKGGGNKIDIDRARTTLDIKKVELSIAKLEHTQQALQLKYRQAQLDRNELRAPFDGRVDEVFVDVGEVKRETDKVVRVVSVNPLWIDVQTPTGQTMTLGLKPGDPAWIVLDIPGDRSVVQGKVIEVGAEADAASDRRRIRVEVPNPKEQPAGLTAWVRFQPPKGEWATLLAPTAAAALAPEKAR